jgi:CRP-like cAMP-binding protein
LNQENELKNNICKDWPSYMYKELCAKAKILHYRSLKKIVEIKKRGGNIYLVLKGAVRIYSVIAQNVNASEYQCDVFPGEIFGDELFKGVLSEYYTALSLTPCEILVLLEKDILGLADEIDVNNMSSDKKMEYLRSVPLFKSWQLQDLYDLGTNLKLETFDKGTQIITKGQISNRLYFIVQGTVNLMRYGATSYRTISCLQKFDYLGESGIINVLKEGKALEHLTAFCTSKVVVLTLAVPAP